MEEEIPPSPWPGFAYAEKVTKISNFEKKNRIKRVKQTVAELTNLFNHYTTKSIQQIHVRIQKPSREELIVNQPRVNFCFDEIFTIEKAIQEIHETYYSGVASQISRIICYFSECEQKGFYPICDTNKLKESIEGMVFKSRIAKQKIKELKYLVSYIRSHSFVPRLPAVPFEHLIPLNSYVDSYTDLSCLYCKPKIFDNLEQN